ncbi:unnamed protein product [Mesocestoides corti]|uniref:Uncharacterized protein n=1 Tax=Mesocestoides corti TaxID=53468 RepID=A0A0R3U625_MESCO|nr:unnamed protein product [Mesocestoides corti]
MLSISHPNGEESPLTEQKLASVDDDSEMLSDSTSDILSVDDVQNIRILNGFSLSQYKHLRKYKRPKGLPNEDTFVDGRSSASDKSSKSRRNTSTSSHSTDVMLDLPKSKEDVVPDVKLPNFEETIIEGFSIMAFQTSEEMEGIFACPLLMYITRLWQLIFDERGRKGKPPFDNRLFGQWEVPCVSSRRVQPLPASLPPSRPLCLPPPPLPLTYASPPPPPANSEACRVCPPAMTPNPRLPFPPPSASDDDGGGHLFLRRVCLEEGMWGYGMTSISIRQGLCLYNHHGVWLHVSSPSSLLCGRSSSQPGKGEVFGDLLGVVATLFLVNQTSTGVLIGTLWSLQMCFQSNQYQRVDWCSAVLVFNKFEGGSFTCMGSVLHLFVSLFVCLAVSEVKQPGGVFPLHARLTRLCCGKQESAASIADASEMECLAPFLSLSPSLCVVVVPGISPCLHSVWHCVSAVFVASFIIFQPPTDLDSNVEHSSAVHEATTRHVRLPFLENASLCLCVYALQRPPPPPPYSVTATATTTTIIVGDSSLRACQALTPLLVIATAFACVPGCCLLKLHLLPP